MNFKTEINHLNIDNYPTMERHFEEMATKGWLIDSIVMERLFVYKKIEPQILNFSISPYEAETAFTRKTKDELKEFQDVSHLVGWEFAANTYNVHIYFKTADTDALPLHTDEDEEFRTIERISNRTLRRLYILTFIFLFLAGIITHLLFNNIAALQDGYLQIIALLLPIELIITGLTVYDLRKFLKDNQQNIETGDSLAFHHDRQGTYKFLYSISFLIIISLVVFALYSLLILKKMTLLGNIIPLLLGLGSARILRVFVKPSKSGKALRTASIFLIVFLVGLGISYILPSKDIITEQGYKFLSFNHFEQLREEDEYHFESNASFLVPASHQYLSFSKNHFLETDYSRALNEGLAKRLVQRYVDRSEEELKQFYYGSLELSFTNNYYSEYLENGALYYEDFKQIYVGEATDDLDLFVDQANEMIINRSITEDRDLWGMDEGYFLTHQKDKLVIRDGHDVFYLRGLDFSDPKIIKQVKNQLELN